MKTPKTKPKPASDAPRAEPPKKPAAVRRAVLTMRLKEATKKRLIDAAEVNERSLSEEIEDRVDKSFEIEDSAGGVINQTIGEAVITTIRLVEARRKNKWSEDEIVARYAYERVVMMLRVLMGLPDLEHMEDGDDKVLQSAFKVVAMYDESQYADKLDDGISLKHLYSPIKNEHDAMTLPHRLSNLERLIQKDKVKEPEDEEKHTTGDETT